MDQLHAMYPEGLIERGEGWQQPSMQQPQPRLSVEGRGCIIQPQQMYTMADLDGPSLETNPQAPPFDDKTAKKPKHRKSRARPANTLTPGETADDLPKKSKKKKSEKVNKTTTDNSVEAKSPKRSKKKKRHVTNDEATNEGAKIPKEETVSESEDFHAELQEATDELNFADEDLPKLLDKIECAIPANDTVAFRTRTKKIDWETIAFDDYTAEKCQETWLYIQKRQRQYRLLSEVVKDANDWIRKPLKELYRGGKMKTHPDFPKRPLSSYMVFYLSRKDKIVAENAGIKLPELSRLIGQEYNELGEEEKTKYAKLAAIRKQEYDVEVEEFFTKHPDVPRTLDRNDRKDCRGPKKAHTPFALFVEDEMKKEGHITDKSAFREQCKEKWRNLCEKAKLFWIDWALELERQFQEHPEYVVPTVPKQILTKEEKHLKERMDGKPDKPPNSAYSLFSRLLLKGDELKQINAKDRMRTIALKWKELPEEQKTYYRDQSNHLVERYKLDYANYLESLPQDKRDIELSKKTGPKRKGKVEEPPPIIVKKNKKDEPKEVEEEEKTTNNPNPLIDVVIPKTWDDMADGERSMYMKYIQKIKDYFDTQHQTALEQKQASNGSDSESDSVSSD